MFIGRRVDVCLGGDEDPDFPFAVAQHRYELQSQAGESTQSYMPPNDPEPRTRKSI